MILVCLVLVLRLRVHDLGVCSSFCSVSLILVCEVLILGLCVSMIGGGDVLCVGFDTWE